MGIQNTGSRLILRNASNPGSAFRAIKPAQKLISVLLNVVDNILNYGAFPLLINTWIIGIVYDFPILL